MCRSTAVAGTRRRPGPTFRGVRAHHAMGRSGESTTVHRPSTEAFQRRVSRVRTALVIDVRLLGLVRALRRVRQVSIRAMALSTDHRRREWVRLMDFYSDVRSFPVHHQGAVGIGADLQVHAVAAVITE